YRVASKGGVQSEIRIVIHRLTPNACAILSRNMTTMNPVSKSPEPNRAAKAAKQVKKFFVWMIVFILVCTAGTVAFLMYASYGDGYRVGTILKLARKGVIFKTWEGELSQGFLESAPDVSAGVGTRI